MVPAVQPVGPRVDQCDDLDERDPGHDPAGWVGGITLFSPRLSTSSIRGLSRHDSMTLPSVRGHILEDRSE